MNVYYIELTRLSDERKFVIRVDTIMEAGTIKPAGTRIYIEERGKDFVDVEEDYQYIKGKIGMVTEVI